jgi:DNA-directed RNA polymerase beta subunit/DNA-directed RNA polymerase beta' subunit
MYPINNKSVYEENGSRLVMVKANVDVKVKTTGEQIIFPMDLLKLPHYGETGFIINGKNRQVIDIYTLSYGWYVLKSASKVKIPHLQMKSELGKNLLIYEKDYKLYITTSNKVGDCEIPLAVFLKAFTGLSYAELANKLGTDSIYVIHSFSQREPLKSDCVDQVITNFFEGFKNNRRDVELKNMSIQDKFELAKQSLFSPHLMVLGDIAGVRMKNTLSFKERCRNLFLGETLTVGEKIYREGMVLDPRTLEELDYCSVDFLKVYDSNKKVYIVRKTSIFNFRALGCVLEEDVRVGNSIVSKGTVLTVEVLKQLDQSLVDNILVSNEGKTYTCYRKLYSGNLEVFDILGMIQVFIDTLSGLDNYDNVYELTNQNLVTIEITALNAIRSSCKVVNYYIAKYVEESSEDSDLLKRVIELHGFDTNSLMDKITSVESVESQQSELNNTIQKKAKEHRVTKQVKRSSVEMTSVREGQFGLLDPIESPESSKIGTVHAKTWLAKTDSYGFLQAPYIKVKNGRVVSKEPVYLTAAEKEDQYIAEWRETFFEKLEDGTEVLKDKVLVLYNDTMLEVPVKDVLYMEYSPYQTMSPARMQIPFQEHSNPKRLLMGSNHHKQTAVPIRNERPLVSSGGDSLLQEGFIRASEILVEYYDSNTELLSGISREDFLTKEIELTNIDINNGSRDLYFRIEGVPNHTPVVNVPFIQKASSGVMFSYQVNTSNGVKYSGDDIVTHSSDIDTRSYDIFHHTDFGNMNVDPKVFNSGIAIARNLVVGYKTYESSTIDDAILLSSELVGTDGLTTVELHRFSYKLAEPVIDEDKGTKSFEEFGFKGKSILPHMTDEGLPKEGSILKPGDVVLGIRRIKNEYTKKETTVLGVFDAVKRLEGTVQGEVIYSYIEGNEAVVMLGVLKPIEEGDKLAGRYGNKGVVAKIVPKSDMPFDPVSGVVPDIIISPLGVPSRSNISQILEGVLGFAMKKLGKIAIVSPYKGNTLEFVRNMAEKTNTKPLRMRDGRTGQWLKRPINVVVMYMLKLEHMVDHKIRGIGLSKKTDPVFNQPNKGAGHAGGQAFGEYETWCIMAVGGKRILQDLQSVQSDDLESIEALEESFAENPSEVDVEGENHNDDLFQVIMRSLCTEATIDEMEGFSFKPLTDSMIRGMNSRSVDINDKDSLRSTNIFGITTNDRERFKNRKGWSWMPLHAELVHPMWITKGKIHRFLLIGKEENESGKVKVMVAQMGMLKELIACKYYIEEEFVKEDKVFVFRRGSTEGKLTGMPALVHMLKRTSFEPIKEFYQKKIENAQKDDKRLEHKRYLRGVLDFEAAGLTLQDFVISSLPVMPLSFRPQAMFKNTFQDFDYYYRRIIDEVSKYKALGKEDPVGIYSIYLRIVELCGLTYGSEIKENKGYTPILKYFAKRENQDKKHGRIRENMLKKRVNFSGRTVIIPSRNPKRLPTQIGLPFLLCLEIWKPQLVSLLSQNLSDYDMDKREWEHVLEVMGSNMAAFRSKVGKVMINKGLSAIEIYDKIYGVISAYIEGYKNPNSDEWVIKPRVVLAGRQPSLHKFNIRAYTPIITNKKCIELHPLVAKGYNADYDGDQMWIIGLVNNAACEEAMEKLSPKYGVINPKDNSVVLDHSQDMKLGVYFATMLHNNVDSITKDSRYSLSNLRFYTDLGQLETDIDLDFLALHDLVCYSTNGRRYLSTAGRVLFNGLLVSGLGFTDEPYTNVLGIEGINANNYCDLRFDGLVSGNGGSRKEPVYVALSDVTSWSYNDLNADENLQVFQAISEFGFKYSDISGISLYLEDFVEDPTMHAKIAKAKQYAEIVNRDYYQGLLSNEVRKNLLIEIYNGCKDNIAKTFVASFDRNNNIFIMFDSGARGTEGQIMQACGVIGILQKSKNETLEVPVLSNYAKGTSSFDTLLLSFSTRTGVASTQNETAISGELTRTAVYMSSGLRIVEHDCGVEFEDFKLRYGKFTDKIIGPSGELVASKALFGKHLDTSDNANNKLLLNFLGLDLEINEKCVNLLIKNKVKRIKTTDGEFKLYYELDSLMKSLLLRRKTEALPSLLQGHYISPATIKYIEQENLDSISLRTILSCRSIGGVCAHCYGMRYDVNKLPEIDDLVGIESAQSIGEPAAQLVLSLFHQGGVAGASINKGVDVLKNLLDSGKPRGLTGAVLPPKSGYVHYTSGDGNVRLVADDGEELMLQTANELIVESGEYVEETSPLTTGFIIPSELENSPSLQVLRFKQMALLELYFRTFELSKIKVNARHFEIFVKLQTSLGIVLDSDDENFKEGRTYELNDILQNSNGSVKYMFDINGSSPVIIHFSGMETEMAREKLADSLGLFVTQQTRSPGKSAIGSLFYGQDVTGSRTKILSLPKKMKVTKNEVYEEHNNLRELEGTIASSLVQVQETQNIVLDDSLMDLDALLSFDDIKPVNKESVDYITLEETKEEETVNSEDKKMDKMKLF